MQWVLAAVALAVAAGFLLWPRRRSVPRQSGGTHSSTVGRGTVALRVCADDDVTLVRGLVARHGGPCAAELDDVAVDLMRVAPTATHFYRGPEVSALRCDLPEGVIVKLDVEPMSGESAVGADTLSGVIATLRALHAPTYAHLSVAESSPAGAALVAVDEDERPGHRRCAHCRHSFVISELVCPNCGAPVRAA